MATLFTALKSLGALGANLDLICDPSVGIVSQLEEVPVEPGSPSFFHYAALACNTEAFCPQRNFQNTGGASMRKEIAVAKAVGEAIERYCAAIYTREEFPLHSAAEAPFPCVAPGSFALHTPEQHARPGFPWVPFTPETPIRWTPAVDLETGKTVHVPAAFVWIPYHYAQGSGDAPIGQPISTGLACHGSPERAILCGLYEVVERDCFTLFWQARTSPAQLRVETLGDEAYEAVRRFEVTGDRVVILDISTDNAIPCLLAVLVSQAPSRPAFVFAASACLDAEVAVLKALEELAHTRRYSQQIKSKLPLVSPENDWEEVVGQMDHLNVAADHGSRERMGFVFASPKRLAFSEIPSFRAPTPADELAAAARRVVGTGHRVLAADLTSADVLSLGFHVYRVLVPGYHPLFMGHSIRALGGRRLHEIPVKLGFPGLAGNRDNPDPHPYP